MALLSRITLPDGQSYDLRDNAAGHYLGVASSALSAGTITTVTVGGTTYALNPTSGQTQLRDQSIVKDSNGLLFIAAITTGSPNTGNWVALTSATNVPVTDVEVDGTTILDSTVGKLSTTGSYDGNSSSANYNPLATKDYVDSAIDALPEPMVYRGTLGTGGTITTLPTDGSADVGDTYKVITDGTYASQAAKVGDLFICLTKTSNANTWSYVPSGDEPSGTVTSVGVARDGSNNPKGLKTDQTNSGPITASGTLSLDFVSGFDTNSSVASATRSSTANREYGLELDSNGKLAVNVPWTDTTYEFANNYDASTNKGATVATVTSAINDLDVTGESSIAASKTISAWSEENGKVSISTQDISITLSQVSDVTSNTTINSVSSSAASSTAATNELAYYTYDAATETLTLNKLIGTPKANVVIGPSA